MAGLRYCPSSPTGPLETKSGAYVYSGDPSHFHEWQFRTLLRVELCKKKMEQKAKEKAKEASSSPVSPASSGRRRREPTEAAEQGDAEETAAEVSPQAPSGEHSAGLGGFASPRSQEEHDLLDVSPYVELVTKVMEGLRGDAFLMAKDLGLNALMDVGPPTGLELLVEKIKEHVFPLRSHEARELFRLGQQANGLLSRQSAETILSFIGRRKRWWIQLKELDPEMAISTQMRAELLLETSGLSRQEQLMVKTACPKPSFEGYSEILLEHHGRIHLRDSRNLAPPSRPFQSKGAGKNKGKGWYRSGYIAGEYNDHGGDEAADDGVNYDWNEDYDNGAYVGYGDEPSTEDPDDCDWVSDEDLGIALTAMAACDMDETSTEGLEELGEACQHQLQAYAAVGRAKGKGPFKGSGKGKDKGKGKERARGLWEPNCPSKTGKSDLPVWRRTVDAYDVEAMDTGQVTQNAKCQTGSRMPLHRSQVKCRAKERLAILPWVIPQETMMTCHAWSLEQGTKRSRVGIWVTEPHRDPQQKPKLDPPYDLLLFQVMAVFPMCPMHPMPQVHVFLGCLPFVPSERTQWTTWVFHQGAITSSRLGSTRGTHTMRCWCNTLGTMFGDEMNQERQESWISSWIGLKCTMMLTKEPIK